MKARHISLRIILIISCLFFTSCEPDGGDLTPILQSGAKVTSLWSKKDVALQYDTEKYSLKVSGKWESLQGDVDFTVIVKNNSSSKIKIDFNNATVSNSLNANIKILSVVNRYTADLPKRIENEIIEIGAGETQTYNIGVGEENRNYKGKIEYRGNEIWMTIPVTFEQNKTAVTTDYYFKFKYDDYAAEGNYNGNLID